MNKTGEEQYLNLADRIIETGNMIKNKRTGKGCLTVINADFEYDSSDGKFPLVTTRKSYWKQAIAEILGYLRGYNNAQQFADIGCNTWFANANENEHWLKNSHRKGNNDLGYGFAYAQGREWYSHHSIDQYKNIIDKLSAGIDDRRLIMTFNNPGAAHASALPACMHTHHFSILDGTLYVTSYQRSIDVPLGLVFNMVQCVWLLRVTAQITGLKPGTVYHKLVNCHIYDDQIELMCTQLSRQPFSEPSLLINPEIQTLEDLETWVNMDDFDVNGYKHHEPIKYPFSV